MNLSQADSTVTISVNDRARSVPGPKLTGIPPIAMYSHPYQTGQDHTDIWAQAVAASTIKMQEPAWCTSRENDSILLNAQAIWAAGRTWSFEHAYDVLCDLYPEGAGDSIPFWGQSWDLDSTLAVGAQVACQMVAQGHHPLAVVHYCCMDVFNFATKGAALAMYSLCGHIAEAAEHAVPKIQRLGARIISVMSPFARIGTALHQEMATLHHPSNLTRLKGQAVDDELARYARECGILDSATRLKEPGQRGGLKLSLYVRDNNAKLIIQ